MDISLNKEKWLTRGISKVNNTDEILKISFKSDDEHRYEYIYYEAITGFSHYSDLDIKPILKNTIYNISFKGNIEGDLDVRLFINTYSYKEKLSSNSIGLNNYEVISTNEDTISAKIAIKVSGEGTAYINSIEINEYSKENYINEIFCKNDIGILEDEKYLLLTNNYPSDNDLYRNAFVHRRVKLYKEKGLDVDVYAVKPRGAYISKYIFEGVEVYKGDYNSLGNILVNKKYKKILIHFVNKDMVDVVNKYAKNIPVIVWLHGYECSSWRHRICNYTENEIEKYSGIWDHINNDKMEFLKSIYNDERYYFILVSNWLKETCEKDAGCKILKYKVIPNVVDENLFKYNKKKIKDRTKILSIRPYTANNYANDLTVKAIIELSKRNIFSKLEFDLYGRGILFNSLTSMVSNFDNVKIHNTFLTQYEIAQVHKTGGIFLCPTRLDTQGVSMCEAMSSGLVCISNDVSAISEYLNSNCGILAERESYMDIANAIEYLYNHPYKFKKMSKESSQYIKDKCGIDNTINNELEIIKS